MATRLTSCHEMVQLTNTGVFPQVTADAVILVRTGVIPVACPPAVGPGVLLDQSLLGVGDALGDLLLGAAEVDVAPRRRGPSVTPGAGDHG